MGFVTNFKTLFFSKAMPISSLLVQRLQKTKSNTIKQLKTTAPPAFRAANHHAGGRSTGWWG
jgi:hypothetical protein